MWPFNTPSWEQTVQEKQQTRKRWLDDAVHTKAAHSPYLKATASEIVQRIASREWTASEVLEAYIAQAARAHAVTNCLTEGVFLDEARGEAQKLDMHFQTTGELKGPLHGVPISFKDLFHVAGYDTTMGHTMFAGQPAESDAEVVRLVREAGGIPFVKTNLSQTLMFFECVNPMWGRTTNPYSDAHTSGGSTGGEAALLAMDGSALGWGNDVGGSMRIPTSYCGVYSLKPAHGRISSGGMRDAIPGFEAITTVTGPMARSVEDLELAFRVVAGKARDDSTTAPVPFRKVVLPEKLTFGYYSSDNYVRSSPVCQRAVLETVAALRRAGHDCVELPFPLETDRAMQRFLGLISSDGNKTLLKPIGKDPVQYELSTVDMGPKLWGWARFLLSWIIEHVAGDPFLADVLRLSKKKSVAEFYSRTAEVREFSRQMNRQLWGDGRFDAIIAPVQAIPALPHQAVARVATICGSTIIYNILDNPVGVIPVTRVDPEKDEVTPEWYEEKQRGVNSSPLLHALLYKGENSVYNAKRMAGLPVGIQIAGRKWEEEKVLAIMKVVDSTLGRRSFGPGNWETWQAN
ncbi:amidase signature enzyme [Irpex rosettiformis]|uniref:Amidase signature enzyme n=1 Tax=Irpex rosettiformis TaxID=378272 RepID=A0ACB8UBU7_9APHY|nr:amidase signature enzyme [Irpex rosettiformis]